MTTPILVNPENTAQEKYAQFVTSLILEGGLILENGLEILPAELLQFELFYYFSPKELSNLFTLIMSSKIPDAQKRLFEANIRAGLGELRQFQYVPEFFQKIFRCKENKFSTLMCLMLIHLCGIGKEEQIKALKRILKKTQADKDFVVLVEQNNIPPLPILLAVIANIFADENLMEYGAAFFKEVIGKNYKALLYILSTIPKELQARFIEYLGMDFLSSVVMNDGDEFGNEFQILAFIPLDQRYGFFESLGTEFLKSRSRCLLHQPVFEMVPIEQRYALSLLIGEDFLKTWVKKNDLDMVQKTFSTDHQSKIAVLMLQDKEFLITHILYFAWLDLIPIEQRYDFLISIEKEVLKILVRKFGFDEILKNLPKEQQKKLLSLFDIKFFSSIIKDDHDLYHQHISWVISEALLHSWLISLKEEFLQDVEKLDQFSPFHVVVLKAVLQDLQQIDRLKFLKEVVGIEKLRKMISYDVRFEDVLSSSTVSGSLYGILKLVAVEDRLTFLKEFVGVENLRKVIFYDGRLAFTSAFDGSNLYYILDLLIVEDRLNFLEKFVGVEELRTVISYEDRPASVSTLVCRNLHDLLKFLKVEDRLKFLQFLGKDFLKAIHFDNLLELFESKVALITLKIALDNLPTESRLDFLKLIRIERLLEQNDFQYFDGVLQTISKKHVYELLCLVGKEYLQTKIGSDHNAVANLTSVLAYLPQEQRVRFLDFIGTDFLKLEDSATKGIIFFRDCILNTVPADQLYDRLKSLQRYLITCLKHKGGVRLLEEILWSLPYSQRERFLIDIGAENLKIIIPNKTTRLELLKPFCKNEALYAADDRTEPPKLDDNSREARKALPDNLVKKFTKAKISTVEQLRKYWKTEPVTADLQDAFLAHPEIVEIVIGLNTVANIHDLIFLLNMLPDNQRRLKFIRDNYERMEFVNNKTEFDTVKYTFNVKEEGGNSIYESWIELGELWNKQRLLHTKSGFFAKSRPKNSLSELKEDSGYEVKNALKVR